MDRGSWIVGCRIVGVVLAVVMLVFPSHLDAADAENAAGWIATMTAAPEQAKTIAASNGVDWCQTQIAYVRKYPDKSLALAACPTQGDCDIPTTRDANIPGAGEAKLTIRLKFNVFCNDDGSNSAASQAGVDAQVAQLNSDFDPSRVKLIYTTEFINSTQFRQFSDSEEGAMKNTYADLPAEQMNIYVVNILAGYLGVGTFAWDPDALGNLGGIIVDDNWFGAGEKTLTHEIGHNLGLWHTHHGVSEVITCSACWERADGVDGDITGDFCGDTDPTPTNYNCTAPGGTDPCSSTPWGPTDPQNYMGYAPDYCYTEFSPQQFGRMHCWINATLSSWLAIGFSATPLAGAEALAVDFTYDSPIPTTAWKWYFGDGDSAMVENPTHLYGPGLFDVSLFATTNNGELSTSKSDYVTVWADTMQAVDTDVEVNSPGVFEIYGVNKVPIKELILPVIMTNVPSVVFLDSISIVGTRLDHFELNQLVFDNLFAGELAVRLRADNGGGAAPLAPGTGLIARVYFRTRTSANVGDTSYLSVGPLGSYTFKATSIAASYEPVFYGATMTVAAPTCDCSSHGDVADDNHAFDAVDLSVLIDHAFYNLAAPVTDPVCPHINRGDLNCDGFDDAVDVSFMIDLVFLAGAPPCDPCACSPYPTNCP